MSEVRVELSLRVMDGGDLPLVARWLAAPHVARWFLAGSSLEGELDELRRSLSGAQLVEVLMVLDGGVPVGWCQCYPCGIDPQWADEMGAAPDDVGIDYAIGSPEHVGRGVGTALVAALVARVRSARPVCALTADPDARNVASRRVLEKNGFELVRVAVLASEPSEDPVAVYRLAPPR
jgi:RimJ/RimL family protein N-acetyltransferase